MNETLDLCCDRCGGTNLDHFHGPDAHQRLRWQNRCLSCRHVSEYMPTRTEIQYECQKLRCEQGRVGVDDEQEKFWRQLRDNLIVEDDVEDSWEEW